MIFNSEENLVFEPIEIDGVTYKFEELENIKNIDKTGLNYLSKESIEDLSKCDYVVAYKDNKVYAFYVLENTKSKVVKPYMPIGEDISNLKMLYYSCDEALQKIIFYMEKINRARSKGIIEINKEDDKYLEFYARLVNGFNYHELDNCIFTYVGFCLKERVLDNLEIRHAYPGEEYDVGNDARWLEDGDTNLGYLDEEVTCRSYAFDYIVGYDNDIKSYFGYLIGDSMRVTDTRTYKCYFVYDFFIYDESDIKYDRANKLFEYLIDLCKYRTVEYIRIKKLENKFYNPFYEYCKKYLNMYEEDGYLVKKI